jgi:hypothetical protein
MNLTSLGLHITDRCNSKCLHCAFGCSSKIRGAMKLDQAKHFSADAKALGTEIVCITGGEPMLYPKLVEKIVSECKRLSFPEIWLFTNCFWGHDTSRAHATVRELRSHGLTKIFTSIDFFHQSWVPIESVKNAIEASLGSGFEVSVDARFIGYPKDGNEFNSATCSYLQCLGNFLPRVEVKRAEPMFVGRAAELLVKYVKMKPLSEVLDEECPGAWAGGTLEFPSGIDVDESGSITICPGLSIGDAHGFSFRRIAEEYDYRDFTVIAALHDHGLRGLLRLASESGFTPDESYVNGCHFCYEARKFLRRIFPEAFTFIA